MARTLVLVGHDDSRPKGMGDSFTPLFVKCWSCSTQRGPVF